MQLVHRAAQLYYAMSDRRLLLEEVERFSESDFIGKEPAIKKMLRIVNTVSRTESSVLIE
ncbi:MAG: hypothetical protein GWN86_20630, partial [Desulfobacterales bacterium]|nr:hypothetical protein [Desulfobacterales bacterium]